MKNVITIMAVCLLLTMAGCCRYGHQPRAGHERYNIPFSKLDRNGDGVASHDEFKGCFHHQDLNIFRQADTNHDGIIEHAEWHRFKMQHGYRHHD